MAEGGSRGMNGRVALLPSAWFHAQSYELTLMERTRRAGLLSKAQSH